MSHSATRRSIKEQQTIFTHTMESLTTWEEEQRDVPDSSLDPYAVLRAKTVGLADLLGCTEAEAERLILNRCDA